MFNKFLILCLSIFTLTTFSAQKTPKKCTKKTTKVAKKKSTAVKKTTTKTETITQKDDTTTTFTLKEGETRFFPELQMNITFKGVSEDSRCPEGTQCIWAGVAVADLNFMGTYTRPVNVKIATTEMADKNLNNKVEFLGHQFKLEKLSPNPTAEKSSEDLKGSYTITLSTPKTALPEKPVNPTTTTK